MYVRTYDLKGLGDVCQILAGGGRICSSSSGILQTPAPVLPPAPCPPNTVNSLACIQSGGTVVPGPAPCYTPTCVPSGPSTAVTFPTATPSSLSGVPSWVWL